MILDGPAWVAAGAHVSLFGIPQFAERIFTWNQNTGAYDIYFLRDSDSQWAWQNDPGGPAPVAKIDLGSAAWLLRPNNATNSFTVTINRPYTYPTD